MYGKQQKLQSQIGISQVIHSVAKVTAFLNLTPFWYYMA